MSQDEFDVGFELEETQATATEEAESENQAGQQEAAPQAEGPEEPVQLPEEQPVAQPQTQTPRPARIAEMPEALGTEFARLRELNPLAAELAMEDSAEGKAIRSRLEHFGAETAQDRAEMTLWRREQELRSQQARRAQVEAYNRGFMETIRREAPEFFQMSSDPARREEAVRYLRNLNGWIESKPYKEGLALAKIRDGGRADQVCAMIRQFENEKAGRKSDAADMYAVPGRGAPVAPSGIGDKNDFDAGWNLHQ